MMLLYISKKRIIHQALSDIGPTLCGISIDGMQYIRVHLGGMCLKCARVRKSMANRKANSK